MPSAFYDNFLSYLLALYPPPYQPWSESRHTSLFKTLTAASMGNRMLVYPETSHAKLPWRKAVISRARLLLRLFQQSLSARMFSICRALNRPRTTYAIPFCYLLQQVPRPESSYTCLQQTAQGRTPLSTYPHPSATTLGQESLQLKVCSLASSCTRWTDRWSSSPLETSQSPLPRHLFREGGLGKEIRLVA